jgi:cysteine desulfuration protein SufE
MTGASLPAALAEIVADFADLPQSERATLLLEFADDLPPLPADLAESAMEPVPECQSPLFLHVDAADPSSVRLYFSAPREAPTTRGFASVLAAGLDRASAAQILAVPDDFHHDLGLEAVISPLRLRGMSAMLTRIKRRLTAE